MLDSHSNVHIGIKVELGNILFPIRYFLFVYLLLLAVPFLWLIAIPMFFVPAVVQIAVSTIIGFLMFLVARAIARRIETRKSYIPATACISRFLNTKDAIVIIALIVGELLLVASHEAAGLVPAFTMEVLCACLKIVGGIVLAFVSRSPGHVAVLAALAQSLLSNSLLTAFFVASPETASQYGPEAIIFAMANSVENMSTSPLGAALIYGVYRVSTAWSLPPVTAET